MTRKKSRQKWMMIVMSVVLIAVVAVLSIVQLQKNTKPLKIIYISKTKDQSDFWTMLRAGAQMAGKEKDAELLVVAPDSEQDLDRQNQLVDEAIRQKPDAILLSPIDYEKSVEAAQKIKAHKIPLVLIDSGLEKDVADAEISTDNVRAGKLAGEFVKNERTADTVIGVVSYVKGSSTAMQREKGFRAGLGDLQFKIVDTVYSESDYQRGYDVTKDLISRHPEITIIAGMNEYSTTGAARAINDMGLKQKVKIVGFDNSIEEIQMLESGVVESIVIQRPFDMGYLGVRTAVSLAKGEDVEYRSDSGCKLVTKDTIYTEENQKLLFPFAEKSQAE